MKYAALVGLSLILCASAAFAAAPSKIDPVLCNTSKIHTLDPSSTYQPGVDVHGKPVTPADLPDPSNMVLPERMVIPLTLDLAKVLNLDTSAYPYSKLGAGTEVQLGKLEIYSTNVFFNGKPISEETWDKLAAACAEPK
jgi:hypothetical protein